VTTGALHAGGDEGPRTSPLERAAGIWSRRKWLAILTALPVATVVLCTVTFLPYLYESSALVVVERQQVPEELVRPTVTSALETRLQTISQEILSRTRLQQLISRFGLYPDLQKRVSPEEVIERMRRDIQLELRGADQRGDGRKVTVAFTISYRGSDPQTVAQVTNTLASFYIEENLKVRERQAAGTADFLKVQLDQVKTRLDQQEKQVGEFKKLHVGELPQELDVNLATLERLNTQLRLNSDNQTRAFERREALLRLLAEVTPPPAPSTPDGGPRPPTPAAVANTPPDPNVVRLAHLRQELTELRTRFSDKYPDVVRLKAEIAEVERTIDEAKATAAATPAGEASAAPSPPVAVARPDPAIFRFRQGVVDVEGEVKALKAEEDRLRSAIQGYQLRVNETPLREQQYRELARDYDSTRELYASLLKRLAESQIAESMEQRQKGEQFRVVDSAIAADHPIAPDRRRLLGMGLALALGLGLAVALVAEHLNTGFHTLDDLRAFTPVPVLASIPRIVTVGDRARRRRRLRLATVGAMLALVLVAGGTFWLARGNEQLASLLAGRRS
jgi:polysaccharide biosynthesis transport protein